MSACFIERIVICADGEGIPVRGCAGIVDVTQLGAVIECIVSDT